MQTSTATELMHAVLDGAATDAQALQLQQLLTADPAARSEFDAVQRLFSDLSRVPQRQPPEGLFAAVMAAVRLPPARAQSAQGRRQLFPWPRVLSPAPRDAVPRSAYKTRLSSRLTTLLRSIDMSDQQTRSTFGNRKAWIGGAVAAAAVLVVWQYGFGSGPQEKDVIGTIAPADRYRAPQPTAADIKLGTPAGGQPTLTNPTAQGNSGQTNAGQTNAGQTNAGQTNAGQTNAGQTNAGQTNAGQTNAGQTNAGQTNAGQTNAGQSNAGQTNAGQTNAGQTNAGQTNAAQTNAGQTNSGQSK